MSGAQGISAGAIRSVLHGFLARGVTGRDLFWLAVFAFVLLAWGWLYLMSVTAGLDLLGRPGLWALTLAELCGGAEASVAGFAAVWGMWAAMGVAMMLPTLVPVMATYEKLSPRLRDAKAGRAGILAGYLAVWAGFAALAAATQIALSRVGLLDDFGAATHGALQAGLLLVAGVWQFTGAKTHCQTQCLTPMSYFLGRYRPGLGGGARMGMELGLYCLGCCWAIMALGFVGGVMNLAWMGLATLFMVLEKLPRLGHALRIPAGVALIIGALTVSALTCSRGGDMSLNRRPDADRLPISQRIDQRMPNPSAARCAPPTGRSRASCFSTAPARYSAPAWSRSANMTRPKAPARPGWRSPSTRGITNRMI